MKYGIIGVGKVGSAIAKKMLSAGKLAWVVDRSNRLGSSDYKTFASVEEIDNLANCVIIASPDGAIAEIARKLAEKSDLPEYVCHLSGALNIDVLGELRSKNVKVFSAHPMQTFGVSRDDVFDDIFWGIESDDNTFNAAKELVETLGGRAFKLSEKVLANKAAYHLIGVAAANFLQGVVEFSRQLANFSGLNPSEVLSPILEIAYDNSLKSIESNTEVPITGPVARCDIKTIESHLESLAGNAELAKLYKLQTEFLANLLLSSERLSESEHQAVVGAIGKKL